MKNIECIRAYSFNCANDIPFFAQLPNEKQREIERLIINIICESFIEPAEEDYITARLLAQTNMHRAFFWAASQAIEKYLKSLILLRGFSVKDFSKGHPISSLYQQACSADSTASLLNTKFHSEIEIPDSCRKILKSLSLNEFIELIEIQGSPDNRYNSFGVEFNSGHLFSLDSLVFGLRQIIKVNNMKVTLEKMDHIFVEKFKLFNPWFAKELNITNNISNKELKLKISISRTTLDQFASGNHESNSRYAIQWLEKKMKLPPKISQQFKNK